jgi:hypothetical protein
VPDPRLTSAPLGGAPVSSEVVIVTDPVADVPVMLTVIPVSVEKAVRVPSKGVPVQVSSADTSAGGVVTGEHGAVAGFTVREKVPELSALLASPS